MKRLLGLEMTGRGQTGDDWPQEVQMRDIYSRGVSVTIILLLLSMLCISCGKASKSAPNGRIETTLNTVEETSNAKGTGNTEEISSFSLLKSGDTKELVGYAFGDEIDYEAFEISGSTKGTELYRLKEPGCDRLNFFFDGKGKGFSGLCIFWEGSFFGINLGEDTLESLISIFGEPNTNRAGEDENEKYAVWNFEQSDMTARILDGKIRGMEYVAAEGIADREAKAESLTDFGKDIREDSDYAESIYNWSAYGSVSKGTYAIYHPYDEGYDENQVGAFVKNYLLSQEITKRTPDGISYNQQGYPFVEYYMDEAKQQYCFVVHLWADYWIDYEKGTSRYRDAVYCTTHILDEDSRVGSLIYSDDAKKNVTHERLYDAYGNRMSDISYESIPGVPFPFITDYWNLNTGYELIKEVLCRNHKTWFYKEQALFDENGKFIRYNGAINEEDWKEYLPYPCTCVYDADGRLEAVEEELQPYDIEMGWGEWEEGIDYSGQLKFGYDDNGVINTVDYFRSSYSHGTTDSSGSIEYDKEGRMIYNSYYITHGSDSRIYLYEAGASRPWVCFNWCSFAPGFENIYLFRPVSR